MSEIPDPQPPNHDLDDEIVRQWQTVFEESTPGLRAFLRSRLAQESDVDDCLQVVFMKMIESGTDVVPASRRAWLFRVAANESARLWRSKASTDKMLERQMFEKEASAEIPQLNPTEKLILTETTEKLYQAIEKLPESWRQVVRLRMVENLTFQQIADQLDIPLGTALTQMRRALERLRSEIETND